MSRRLEDEFQRCPPKWLAKLKEKRVTPTPTPYEEAQAKADMEHRFAQSCIRVAMRRRGDRL